MVCETLTVTGVGIPNLVVTIVNVASPVELGSIAYIDITYENTGNVTGNAMLHITVNDLIVHSENVELYAGAVHTITRTFTPTSVGVYNICAYCDPSVVTGTGTLYGVVKDINDAGIPYVTVTAVDVSDASKVFDVTADINGDYSLTIPVGTYTITWSKTGYISYVFNNFYVSSDMYYYQMIWLEMV